MIIYLWVKSISRSFTLFVNCFCFHLFFCVVVYYRWCAALSRDLSIKYIYLFFSQKSLISFVSVENLSFAKKFRCGTFNTLHQVAAIAHTHDGDANDDTAIVCFCSTFFDGFDFTSFIDHNFVYIYFIAAFVCDCFVRARASVCVSALCMHTAQTFDALVWLQFQLFWSSIAIRRDFLNFNYLFFSLLIEFFFSFIANSSWDDGHTATDTDDGLFVNSKIVDSLLTTGFTIECASVCVCIVLGLHRCPRTDI